MATPLVFLLGESYGQRSLVSYSLQGCKESDMIEVTQNACMHVCIKCKVLFFKLIFVGIELLYNVVLVPTVQHNESARHVSPPCWTSFPFRSPQCSKQSSLCYVACSHYLSVLYVVSIVYIMSIPISQFLPPHHPFPLVSMQTILFAKQNRHTDIENRCMDTTGCFEVHAKFAQSCPILCDPMDDSPPGYSVHAGSPGKNTGVGCHALLQGAFPIQGSNPVFHIAGGFFTTWSTREAKITILMGCKVVLCALCSFAKSVYALK